MYLSPGDVNVCSSWILQKGLPATVVATLLDDEKRNNSLRSGVGVYSSMSAMSNLGTSDLTHPTAMIIPRTIALQQSQQSAPGMVYSNSPFFAAPQLIQGLLQTNASNTMLASAGQLYQPQATSQQFLATTSGSTNPLLASALQGQPQEHKEEHAIATAVPTLQGQPQGGEGAQTEQPAKKKQRTMQHAALSPAAAAITPGLHNRQRVLDHPPICLFIESDTKVMSEYQCLIRQQIEAFTADQDDVQFHISKMSKAINVGRVGIRCRHCAALPQYYRAKGAVYYPKDLNSLYQFGQNLVKNHLLAFCKTLPDDIKAKMETLRHERRRGKGGREHWASSAKQLGIDEDDTGLYFME